MSDDELLISQLREIGEKAELSLADYLEDFVRDPQAFRQRLLEFVATGVSSGPEPNEDEDAFLHRRLENARHIARDLIKTAHRSRPNSG